MQSHPLTQNPRSVDTDPELGSVPLAYLHHIDRARYAIEAIARMVGNSASEPYATGSQPLDAWTVAALMGGVEGLCDQVSSLTDAMLEQARIGAGDADQEGGATHNGSIVIQ
ncbi:hypothetical protein LMG26854_01399 [Achromobacter aegrifaciens]|uniref:hypothetical protein n=1 Tax=Achromobacter aegrifaciens TaxID=1287736 RepID=UPI0014674031|nr:hypothetical protein [Achromobacter aegrifaciens]CAB3819701.1 hypothetical protein LMG26854_01399 [Achromobacter aegrifaciens]